MDGNATATVNDIAAHEWLFRFGIVGDLVCGVILIFLVLAFNRLFKGVDQNLAVLVRWRRSARSFQITTWSRHSRRMASPLPMSRST